MQRGGRLNVAGKPGIVTDKLTLGVYDESTRDYDNVLTIEHCLQVTTRREEEVQVRTEKRDAS